MLELAILGLLKERSMHGYQLSKRLADTLGGFWKVSYGSLYPTLRRLEREGAVEPVFAKQEVGRRKNVYRITQKGEELFYDLRIDAYTESLMKHGADATEQDIAWLDGLIKSERRKVQAGGTAKEGGRRRTSSTFPTKERAT